METQRAVARHLIVIREPAVVLRDGDFGM